MSSSDSSDSSLAGSAAAAGAAAGAAAAAAGAATAAKADGSARKALTWSGAEAKKQSYIMITASCHV